MENDSLPAEFLFLQEKEDSFLGMATGLLPRKGKEVDESIVNEFAYYIGEYNKLVNAALKAYALIDYRQDPGVKIKAKARLKFSYDFMDLLVDLLKRFELEPPPRDAIIQRVDLLEELLLQRDGLLVTTYADAARVELRAFHDEGVRNALDRLLLRRIEDQEDEK